MFWFIVALKGEFSLHCSGIFLFFFFPEVTGIWTVHHPTSHPLARLGMGSILGLYQILHLDLYPEKFNLGFNQTRTQFPHTKPCVCFSQAKMFYNKNLLSALETEDGLMRAQTWL